MKAVLRAREETTNQLNSISVREGDGTGGGSDAAGREAGIQSSLGYRGDAFTCFRSVTYLNNISGNRWYRLISSPAFWSLIQDQAVLEKMEDPPMKLAFKRPFCSGVS